MFWDKKRFWYFLIFISAFLILSSSALVRAAEMNFDIKYVIDAQTGLTEEAVTIYPGLAEGYYYTYTTFSSLPAIVSHYTTTGDCAYATMEEGGYAGPDGKWYTYNYIKCQPGGDKFENGEQMGLQISGDCNCTNKWGGIINEDYTIKIFPFDFSTADNQEASIGEVIRIPSGYYVYNTSISDLSVKTVSGGQEASFSAKLYGGQSLRGIYGGDYLFIEFRKKLDFNNIKSIDGKYKDTNIKIAYPSGFEDDAKKMLAEIQKILPYYEKYGATTFSDLKYYVVENSTYACDAAGCAWASTEIVNISVDSGIDTLYHETCHLTEKSLSPPSWFAEGEATNCEVTALKYFGHLKEAERSEEKYREGYALPNKVDLQTWIAVENIKEDVNLTSKGYGTAFVLMGKILEKINMPAFYTKMRNAPPINISLVDDGNYNGLWVNNINNSGTDVFVDIGSSPKIEFYVKLGKDDFWVDAVKLDTGEFWMNSKKEFRAFGNKSSTYLLICGLNESSKTNLIPLFEGYGFTEAHACEQFQELVDKMKDRAFADMTEAINARDRHNTIVGIITILIMIGFVALMVYLVIRKRKRMGK